MVAVAPLSHIGRILFLLIVSISISTHALGQEEETLGLSREIEKVGERQYMVTVTVEKGEHQGYAKLEEMIPESFVPTKKETRGANYIYQDGKAKFIWMDFPSESDFQVVYKLTQKRGKPGTYDIQGRISCVSGEDLLRVEEKSSFEVEEPRLAQGKGQQEDPGGDEEEGEATASSPSGEDTVSTDADEGDSKKLASNGQGMTSNTGDTSKSNEKEKKEESSEGEKKEKRDEDAGSSEEEKAKKNEESKEDEPEWEKEEKGEEEDAHFSVQIGAFGEEKSNSYFEERYSLSPDEIDSYREGGLIKYTTGRFGTYEQARKTKEDLRSKGMDGAFVVGFKGSEPVDASRLRE